MALTLPLPKDSDLPGDVVERLRSLPAINIYRMLGHAPKLSLPGLISQKRYIRAS
jgi:hypothetical protein